MSRPTNEEIVQALKACLNHLSETSKGGNGKFEFICWALEETVVTGRCKYPVIDYIKRNIIQARIGSRYVLLTEWLEAQPGVDKELICADEGRYAQAHRKAWVKQLIAEFSAK